MAESSHSTPPHGAQTQPGWTPVPDPTLLTTQATDAAKEQLRRELAAVREQLTVRLDGMHEATKLFQSWRDTLPTLIRESSEHFLGVMAERFRTMNERFGTVNERFSSIQTQFSERDVRVDESAKATKIAVDAALSAQEKSVAAQNESFKESIEKSERAFEKQMDALRLAIESMTAGFNALISDAKGRLDRLEGITLGTASSNATHQTGVQAHQGSQSNTVALIGLVVGSVIAIAGLIVAFALKA